VAHDGSDRELRLAFARYEQALEDGERQRLRLARLSLCRLLEADGWPVPEEVRAQLWRDRRALLEQEQAQDLVIDLSDAVRLPSHRPVGSIGAPAATPA
jgi:hypothetical protein